MNKNFPIEIRHKTLKKYIENYGNDLKAYLDSYEDNSEIDFLEKELFSHKEYLKYLLTKTPETNDFDEGVINQSKINSQKKIITYIKDKIPVKNNLDSKNNETNFILENTLKWQGTLLQFTELMKAIIESNLISPEQSEKEIFERTKRFLNVPDFNKSDKLKDIRNRSVDLTPLINTLEVSLTNWIKNKD